MPTASIIVPAFNVAETLGETLSSLLAQSFTDYEILVVDDGSTDGTPGIIADFAARDARIRPLRQVNRGLAGARNTGIAAARGAYIGFCDADDLWHPDKLGVHVAHLDQALDVGISFSGSAFIDEDSKSNGLAQRPRLYGIDAAHVFQRNPVGNGSAAVMRREAVEALLHWPRAERERAWVFDENFRQSEDIECWLRLVLMTRWRIEGVPGLLVQYRVNGTGLSAATDKQRAAWEQMVAKLSALAPAFFAQHTQAARAYQLRYLARRAVSSGDGGRAWALIREAMGQSLRPLVKEPSKTLTTLCAAIVLASGGAPLVATAKRLRASTSGALAQ